MFYASAFLFFFGICFLLLLFCFILFLVLLSDYENSVFPVVRVFLSYVV